MWFCSTWHDAGHRAELLAAWLQAPSCADWLAVPQVIKGMLCMLRCCSSCMLPQAAISFPCAALRASHVAALMPLMPAAAVLLARLHLALLQEVAGGSSCRLCAGVTWWMQEVISSAACCGPSAGLLGLLRSTQHVLQLPAAPQRPHTRKVALTDGVVPGGQ
jgi:hypothetical protein